MDEKDETQIKIEKMLKKAAVILEAGKYKRGARNGQRKEKAAQCAIAIIRDFCKWSALSSCGCLNCPLHGNCMVRIPKYWDKLN